MKTEHFEWVRKIRTNLLVPGMEINRSDDNEGGGGGGEGKLAGPCPAPVPRLHVDRPDGGLVVAGVEIGNSCQVALPISGLIFVIIGAITTVVAYQGPVCLSVGLLMLVAGGIICLVIRYVRLKDQRVCYHCPIHGGFFPLIPVPVSAVRGRPRKLFFTKDPASTESPSCPYSLLSARNSVSSQGSCPAPTPFIINNNSHRCAEYFWPLTVSSDIASFPATRTPSPTPINQILEVEHAAMAHSPHVSTLMPQIRLVAPARDSGASPGRAPPGGASPGRASPGGDPPGRVSPGGASPGRASPGGGESDCTKTAPQHINSDNL